MNVSDIPLKDITLLYDINYLISEISIEES